MATKRALRTQKVGDLAEDDFKRWCTLNELSAVKAVPDRMGWDFFVEFEAEVDDEIPLDQQTDLKKALVQIKATDRASNAVRGKLSAFKKLVDADLPAFILHIDYSGQNSPKLARLLHIGATQIEAILRRVRQAEKDGRFDLHNIKCPLPLDEATEVAVGETSLREVISAAVPTNGCDYITAKATLRRRCGFDEHSIKAFFKLAPGQNEDALSDLLVGKLPQLKVSELVVSKARFGIELPRDVDRIENATLSVNVKPFERGTIVASSPRDHRRVEMPVDVYGLGRPVVPERLRRIRIANDFIELDMRFATRDTRLNWSVDPLKIYTIDTIATVIAFAATLKRESSRIEILLGQRSVADLDTPRSFSWPARLTMLDEFAELLSTALMRHRRGANFEITIRELERMLDDNENMFALLMRPGMEMTFAGNPDLPPTLSRRGWFYCPVGIEFGPFIYMAVIRAPTSEFAIAEDGSIRVVGGKPSVAWDGIENRQSFRVADLNARAKEISEAERGEGDGEFVITTSIEDPDEEPQISWDRDGQSCNRREDALAPGRVQRRLCLVEARED